MSKATEYLDILQKKEPQMFQEPLQKSLLTEKDIGEIEQKLKYAFPKPYKDFLMAYKMPEKCVVRVYYSDDISASYDEEDDSESMEVEWFNPAGNTVEEFLQNAAKEDDYISDDFSALEAGFLKIAEIEGYHIYLDLVTGKVVRLYHEELWEMTVVEGVDGSDKEEIRDYILDNELCPDFYDFLKVVCTHEINGELGPNY